MDEPNETSGSASLNRRQFLGAIASGLAATLGMITVGRSAGDSDADRDGDGIPDALERSSAFHAALADTFGEEQVERLDPDRLDLLVDARYVGDSTVDESVKRFLEERFRENGISMQWLDYPERYDAETFDRRYGNDTRHILWSQTSFYRTEVEAFLRETAFQLVVVPGKPDAPREGRIYSPWVYHALRDGRGGYVNGMNFGNRAVVADRDTFWGQARLIFHEIAHVALCHDHDPDNAGVMGQHEELTLTDDEWATLRANLDNVDDATGYDVLGRQCLWQDPFG